MNPDLFTDDTPQTGATRLGPQAQVLRGFALPWVDVLWPALQSVVMQAPWRHMRTPGGPMRCSQVSARRWVGESRHWSTTWCAPRPIHQVTTPPSVLPAVATAMAGQNSSGLSLTRPNSTGSEPIGNSVAATKATTNSVDSPYSGSASAARSCCNQASIRGRV